MMITFQLDDEMFALSLGARRSGVGHNDPRRKTNKGRTSEQVALVVH